MPATSQEVETSTLSRIANNEARVVEEKRKRSSCIDSMKLSLAMLNEVLIQDLETSEEKTASASADAELEESDE